MKRRFFLLAAPAIVAAPSLMRVSALVGLLPKESIHDLLRRRIKAAEAAMAANLDQILWGDSSHSALDGLVALVREDAPSVVGINRTTFEWWDAGVTFRIETA